ncbi:hypothetical protein MKX03_010353 [Papaver bracteatum]|nr:hypothetical protein MKX03_010353 [Papaver bracteatum]
MQRRIRVAEQVRRLNATSISGECALCLELFRDGDALRILSCDHVCHTTDCIDYWLLSAKSITCPVFRFNLKDNVPDTILHAGNVVIDVMEDNEEHSEMMIEEVINPNNEIKKGE